MVIPQNIFANVPDRPDREIFENILETRRFRVERIISRGQVTPPGEWYDQATNEWVLVLKGRARLRWQDDTLTELSAGDYLLIPAHVRHRVDWTDPAQETLWLAIHFENV